MAAATGWQDWSDAGAWSSDSRLVAADATAAIGELKHLLQEQAAHAAVQQEQLAAALQQQEQLAGTVQVMQEQLAHVTQQLLQLQLQVEQLTFQQSPPAQPAPPMRPAPSVQPTPPVPVPFKAPPAQPAPPSQPAPLVPPVQPAPPAPPVPQAQPAPPSPTVQEARFRAQCDFFMGPPNLFARPPAPGHAFWPPAAPPQAPVPAQAPMPAQEPWWITKKGSWDGRFCLLCRKYCDEEIAHGAAGTHEGSEKHLRLVRDALRNERGAREWAFQREAWRS